MDPIIYTNTKKWPLFLTIVIMLIIIFGLILEIKQYPELNRIIKKHTNTNNIKIVSTIIIVFGGMGLSIVSSKLFSKGDLYK